MSKITDLTALLNFDTIDTVTPADVAKEQGKQLQEATKGIILGEVRPYNGPISSYTRKINPIGGISAMFATTEENVDIQNSLGELDYKRYRYEFFLTTPEVDTYRFRIMIFEYGMANYPLHAVIEKSIAEEITPSGKYNFEIQNRTEFEELFGAIISSQRILNVLQELIASAQIMKELQKNNMDQLPSASSNNTDSNYTEDKNKEEMLQD